MNGKCKYVIKQRRKLRKKLTRIKKRKSGRSVKRAIQLRKHINYLTKKLRTAKKDALMRYQTCIEQEIREAAIGDTQTFYKLYNQATKNVSSNITPLKDSNGSIISTTREEKAQMLHLHFNRKVKENDYLEENIDHHDHVSAKVDSYINNKDDNIGY